MQFVATFYNNGAITQKPREQQLLLRWSHNSFSIYRRRCVCVARSPAVDVDNVNCLSSRTGIIYLPRVFVTIRQPLPLNEWMPRCVSEPRRWLSRTAAVQWDDVIFFAKKLRIRVGRPEIRDSMNWLTRSISWKTIIILLVRDSEKTDLRPHYKTWSILWSAYHFCYWNYTASQKMFPVQKFWQSVNIGQSYRQFQGGNFLRHCVHSSWMKWLNVQGESKMCHCSLLLPVTLQNADWSLKLSFTNILITQ